MGARLAAITDVIRERLERHRSVFTRIAASGVAAANDSADAAGKLAQRRTLAESDYTNFMRAQLGVIQRVLSELIAPSHGPDSFRIASALQGLRPAVDAGGADGMAIPHGCMLNKVDSLLTMRQLENGNVADILQNARWQKHLYTIGPRVARIDCAADVRKRSGDFIHAYGLRKVSNKDYPDLVRAVLPCFSNTAAALGDQALHALLPRLEQTLGDLVKLQKAHRDYLWRLQDLSE